MQSVEWTYMALSQQILIWFLLSYYIKIYGHRNAGPDMRHQAVYFHFQCKLLDILINKMKNEKKKRGKIFS
jgi:hypothetical protein